MARKPVAPTEPDIVEPTAEETEPQTGEFAESMAPVTPPEETVWRWIGARLIEGTPVRFVLGVPSRDLTQSNIDALTDEERERAMASGLYAAEKASE